MDTFIIRGGQPLYGTVRVSGAKNAALPLLFACMLTRGVSRFHRIPHIRDVQAAFSLLSSYGARIHRVGEGTYDIDTTALTYRVPDAALVCSMRASTYLLGASLGRFGSAVLQTFGGCAFSARPIDMHIGAARCFGASLEGNVLTAEKLHGGHVIFPKISVGATVNALLLAVCADGESVLENVALEPHIVALIEYLRKAGAHIIQDSGRITVRGGTPLYGAEVDVVADMIEAGTYVLCGLVTGGCVRVENIPTEQLTSFCDVLMAGGCTVRRHTDDLSVYGRPQKPLSVTAAPYPAFPTDLQPPMAALMAIGCGGEILDTVFPDRYGYTDTLAAFGVRADVRTPLLCIEPSRLYAAEVCAPDLRGGASALLCALAAKGESRIANAELLMRGYEYMIEKLTDIGAQIRMNDTLEKQ